MLRDVSRSLSMGLFIGAFVCLFGGPSPVGAAPETEKKYALLVGVNEYEHAKLPTLKYAENDVADLAVELRKAGYEVILLSGAEGKKDRLRVPTKENIEKSLAALMKKYHKGDTILLAFAGHGVQFESKADCYFCPRDAKPFKDKTDTLIALSQLYHDLETAFEGTKIMLVDACRNDPDPSRGSRGIDADSAPRPPKGVAALFSCSAGQRAYESDALKHGIFFHSVLEALQGKGGSNDKGEVTWSRLTEYVPEKVETRVPKLIGSDIKQSPNMKADLAGRSPVLVRLFVPLFNGKDLTGWKTHPKQPGNWRVEKGILIGSGMDVSYLYTERDDYTAFHLLVEARINEKGNSGVFFRTAFGPQQPTENPIHAAGYEAQIALTDLGAARTGSLYPAFRPQIPAEVLEKIVVKQALHKPDEWFTMEVIAVGPHLVIKVNGKTTVDFKDANETFVKGHLALQLNGIYKNTIVEFRKIEIKELTR